MNLEQEVLKDKNLMELTATVKAHMQLGWKPKGKIMEHKGGFALEMERPLEVRWLRPIGLRSWVAWPKYK
ncbi:hypothetical protein [Pontibacter actiniarum]|uniref:Uncharacterized protein n=1 Tax=Pontibacter actiniarum TaxID=323450 RepID=A0A1X9YNJ6_9BACT|nr:hypothetical protein [Pontibacter actiniarum]ARS34456.1 hypothetical protein CA264_02800 [Pontibacter actiniarum]